MDNEVLLNWVNEQIKQHEGLVVADIASVFRDGRILGAIVSHYRPDLLDFSTLSQNEAATNNQIAFDILEKEIGKLNFSYSFCDFSTVFLFRDIPFDDGRRNDKE